MNPTRLAIAAGVLALLGGAVWWSNKEEAKKEGQPAPGASPEIIALKEIDIKEIEIKKGTDVSTTLKKDEAGKWQITAPEALAADFGAVANLTSAVTKMASERVVDDNVPAGELGNYGLSPAVVTATFTLAGGTKKTVLVGADNPTGNAVYVKLEGDNRLFTATSSVKSSLSKDWKDLREKHIVQFETDKVSRLEMDRAKGAVEFSKIADSEWQLLNPKAARADGFQIEVLARKVHEIQMDPNVDAKAAAAGFGGAAPVATVKLTTPAGVESVEVRKQKDELYAKVKSGTYKLNKDSVLGLDEALSKATDDLRNKKVFDFGFSDPTKIDVKDGAGKLLATLEVQASVSEDPAFTILPHAPVGATLVTNGRDTNGISYHAEVKVGARAGGAAPLRRQRHCVWRHAGAPGGTRCRGALPHGHGRSRRCARCPDPRR